MSVQERPTSPLPLKTEVKPRPEIPPKPQASSPTPGDRRSSGKVKRIVNKFSKQESIEAKEEPANVATELLPNKKFKRPPTIKPKPGRNGLQRQVAAEQAPPLPMKRSRILQKQKDSVGGEDGDSISVEGGRSGTVEELLREKQVSCVKKICFSQHVEDKSLRIYEYLTHTCLI